MVQQLFDGDQLLEADLAGVHALGQELRHQAAGILVGAKPHSFDRPIQFTQKNGSSHMINKLKNILGLMLMPVVQAYVRHAPFQAGKLKLLSYFFWRENIKITNTLFGAQMKLNTNDLVQGYIYYFGVWEPNLTYFMQSRLKNNCSRTFIDVGANVGFFSLLCAKYLSDGRVVSIEAFPSIYNRLVENVQLNEYKNIRTVNIAATDKPMEVLMYHAEKSNEGATTSLKGKFQTTPIAVDGLPLSDILLDSEIETTRIIKIDTEGAEYSVLCGLFPILNKLPEDVEIIVEITPDALNHGEMDEIFGKFSDAGFFPYLLINDYSPESYLSFNKKISLSRMESLPNKQTDIVFSKIDKNILSL